MRLNETKWENHNIQITVYTLRKNDFFLFTYEFVFICEYEHNNSYGTSYMQYVQYAQ